MFRTVKSAFLSVIVGIFTGLIALLVMTMWEGRDLSNTLSTDFNKVVRLGHIAHVTGKVESNVIALAKAYNHILLRGADPASRDKYLSEFKELQQTLRQQLTELEKDPTVAGYSQQHQVILTLATDLRIMVDRYEEALKHFVSDDPLSSFAVDKVVKGIDRPVSKAAGELSVWAQNELGAVSQSALTSQAALIKAMVIDDSVFAFLFGSAVTVALWLMYRGLMTKLGAEPAVLVHVAQRVAKGHLQITDLERSQPTEGSLAQSIEALRVQLRGTLSNIADSSTQVKQQASDVLEQTTLLKNLADQTSQSTADMASSIEQLTTSIAQVSDSSSEAHRLSEDSRRLSGNGLDVVNRNASEIASLHEAAKQMLVTISNLGDRSQDINRIVEVIEGIAAQTNLLALNAAIEAARAGEQGRGFAVVADEVRSLAERTTQSTTEIAQMVQAIQGGTTESVNQMSLWSDRVNRCLHQSEELVVCMREIEAHTSTVQEVVQDISLALKEQSQASTRIAQHVEKVSQTAEENAVGANAVEQVMGALGQLSEDLNRKAAHYSSQVR